ncbi:peptide-methionine (R)-S-oxide reductase [Jannaschia rubra]|uniref:peptide-methionine (R)-S-oxide reductase n=1 Tax=Jannaschia rubra TaxID=282197 RepID=UPI00248F50FB|nr:peptide-methionine (R)-S-oxide reductase [Jannaschia rubra]
MSQSHLSRRDLLASGTLAAATLAAPRTARAEAPDGAFAFEVAHPDAEWRAMLTSGEYDVMRQGATEAPRSSGLWDKAEPGTYACRGCDLPVYEARWKVLLDKGWLFFRHSRPDTVLTSIDRSIYGRFSRGDDSPTMMAEPIDEASLTQGERDLLDPLLSMEVHCRRCGSHFGHILHVENKLLHCVNGIALTFAPETA